jgi:prepilin peptidase CpaA
MMVGLAQAVFVASLAGAAACDLATRRIPDAFALAIVAGFAVIAAVQAAAAGLVAWHLVAGTAVFGAGALLFFMGVLGGGDVKLMGAAALWIGWSGTPRFLVLVCLFGGALALAVLLARLALRRVAAPRLRRAVDSEEGLPYGVAIAGAALLAGLPAPLAPG